MKKFVITMFAFCFVQFSFGQSIKSIKVNNSTQMYNQTISITDIDSITYDIDTQSQIVHTKNGIESCPLSEVDSLSFLYEEAVNALFTQEYMENATTCLFSNGWALSISADSFSNYTITIDSFDFATNSWDSTKSMAIYCDSLHRPIIAQNDQYTYFFSNYIGDSFDLKVVKPDGEEIIVEGFSYSIPQKARRRVNWTQEINSSNDKINGALFIYDNIDAIYNPTPTGIGTTIASWINNLFVPSGTSQDAISWGISAIAALFAPGVVTYTELTLSTKQLILSKAKEEAEKRTGKCTAHISKVSRRDGNTAVVNFDISGVSSSSIEQACYQINYWAIVNGQKTNVIHTTEWKYAENGSKSIDIPNLSGGKYGFQLIIFPRSLVGHHNLINLFKIPSNVAYLEMEPIYIDEIKQDYTTYANDNVIVSMKAKLKFMSEQDQTILSYYDSYGLYYKYDNNNSQREDYISVKDNGGLVFYVTLDIPRDEFSCDYSNYVATCSDKITFKTYTIDGWGIKEFYDEQEPKITYDEKPLAITIGMISTEKTAATVKCQYKNYGFWKAVCGVEYTSNGNTKSKTVYPEDENELKIDLTGLTSNTTYKYRAYFEVNGKKEYGDYKSFTTEKEPDPVATTGDYSNVTKNSATVSCTYENVPEGGVCGVEYSWTDGSTKQVVGNSNGTQSTTLSGLKPGTNYTYRAYIDANGQTYYGDDKTFTTEKEPDPVATTGDYSNISKNSATVSCTYENVPEGGVCGVEYSWSDGSAKQVVGNSNGTQSTTLSGLKPGTNYTYRAYIDANGQTYYGDDKTFMTEEQLPDVVGTWQGTQYALDGNVYEQFTLKINADGTAEIDETGEDIMNSGVAHGTWSVSAAGDVWVNIVYYSTDTQWSSKSLSGRVDNVDSPSRVDGTVYWSRGHVMGGYADYEHTFVMTK